MDVLDWDDSLRSGFGPTARTRGVGGVASLDAYGLLILTNTTAPESTEIGDFLSIERFDDEVPTNLVAEPIDLDADKQYQLRFSGTGTNLVGELFDLSDLSSPVTTVTATDATYPAGGGGMAAGAAGLDPAGWILPEARADVTFDNYSITATVPEPKTEKVLRPWPNSATNSRGLSPDTEPSRNVVDSITTTIMDTGGDGTRTHPIAPD